MPSKQEVWEQFSDAKEKAETALQLIIDVELSSDEVDAQVELALDGIREMRKVMWAHIRPDLVEGQGAG